MTTIQSILASLFLGLLIGMGGAWKYQENKYERQIEHDKAAAVSAQSKATTKVLTDERSASKDVSSISSEYLRKSQELSAMQARWNELNAKYHGLFIRVSSCQASSAAASSSPSRDPVTESSQPEQWAELPTDVAARLQEVAKAADDLRIRAEAAKSYAEEIVKIREGMMKEQQNE